MGLLRRLFSTGGHEPPVILRKGPLYSPDGRRIGTLTRDICNGDEMAADDFIRLDGSRPIPGDPIDEDLLPFCSGKDFPR